MTAVRTRARLAVPFIWAAAMAAARILDPWIPIALAALAMSAVLLAGERLLLRELFRPSRQVLVTGLISAAVMVGSTYVVFPLLEQMVPVIRSRTAELYATFLTGRPMVTVLLFILPIVCAEEIMWRGAFQEWVATNARAGPVLIATLSAAVYALAHVPLGSLLLVAVAFVCGLFWALLRSFSKSLIPPLIAHLAWDIALVVIPLRRS